MHGKKFTHSTTTRISQKNYNGWHTKLIPRERKNTCAGGIHLDHRSRRIYAEEKAKVVAAVWGTELINFLAALAATIFAFSSCSICPSSLVIGYVTSFLPHFGLCENAILYACTLNSNTELKYWTVLYTVQWINCSTHSIRQAIIKSSCRRTIGLFIWMNPHCYSHFFKALSSTVVYDYQQVYFLSPIIITLVLKRWPPHNHTPSAPRPLPASFSGQTCVGGGATVGVQTPYSWFSVLYWHTMNWYWIF